MSQRLKQGEPQMRYPKRLIEVDLPIKRISAHARREKSIRHGHISTLHIWWARRPLAACRAVLCAALWPDPADELCPATFIDKAEELMLRWAKHHISLCGGESQKRFLNISVNPSSLGSKLVLRQALLDFIADFANWDNSTVSEYLDTSRILTQVAHEALGGIPGTRPLVVDPFAGGGSIPLEALRVGADAFASDLNPIPVLLNKVILEYIPKYGQRLADEVRKWGNWIKQEAEKELAQFYPKDPDGATPIAYLWARTIKCEGPGCGVTVPMMRSFVISRSVRTPKSISLDYTDNNQLPSIRLVDSLLTGGTNNRGSATCPKCGFTTCRSRIVQQCKTSLCRELLMAVVMRDSNGKKYYASPTMSQISAFDFACEAYDSLRNKDKVRYSIDEELPYLRSIFNVHVYSINTWGKLHNVRQKLALFVFADQITFKLRHALHSAGIENGLAAAVEIVLALCVNRVADYLTTICRWDLDQQRTVNTFCRQALGMVWDYAENVPYARTVGSWSSMLNSIVDVLCMHSQCAARVGTVVQSSATKVYLPDDIAQCFFTDPPYYDAIPYANLSDFFLVWLKRILPSGGCGELENGLSPKSLEAVQLAERNAQYAHKTREFFHNMMTQSFLQGRSIVSQSGISIVVFAHKDTDSWETLLSALLQSGWVVMASWPLDTEQVQRLRAMNSAALSSSVHLVCRPRHSSSSDIPGDWRDILEELPRRIHDWMPRLADEGVAGADAIFACLGPALEIFSRYSRVEKASGEVVTLHEYLEQVWAAVANEAISMIFGGAETSSFEADARLTAMWLWTLGSGGAVASSHFAEQSEGDSGDGDDDGERTSSVKISGYSMEYDAARKIAQGLGIHLDKAGTLVEIKKNQARLLSVAERSKFLFGKQSETKQQKGGQKLVLKPKLHQMDMFPDLDSQKSLPLEYKTDGVNNSSSSFELEFTAAKSLLDQLHQAMIIFSRGKGAELQRLLVENAVGKDVRFWKLAQSLSALYPVGSDEKRWVDGVLARKKGLGF